MPKQSTSPALRRLWIGLVGLLLAMPISALAQDHCSCAEQAPDDAQAAHFEPSFVLSMSGLPRVDGWDDEFGHRAGWGLAGGVDLSPWDPATEVHVEVTWLKNRRHSLASFDLGLKVPFHRGINWDVHVVVGPALAYEHGQITREDGQTERESEFVVGMIAAVGVAYWFHTHAGVVVDVNYRVLGGEGIAHRLFEALGLAARW